LLRTKEKSVMNQENTDEFYLSKAVLSGYKSIENVEIEFEKGLNIIIGQNAAGKTNFLSFLNSSLTFSHDNLFDFSSKLFFSGKKAVVITANTKQKEAQSSEKLSIHIPEIDTFISINDTVENSSENIEHLLTENNLFLSINFIRHGVPENSKLIDLPFSFKINKSRGAESTSLLENILDTKTPFFAKLFMLNMYVEFIKNKKYNNKNTIIDSIKKHFSVLDKVKKSIIRYSPIEDLRFNQYFNVFEDDKNYTISNLFVEYKLQGNWHPFSNLSDGTKRLFYLISEVCSPVSIYRLNQGVSIVTKSEDINKIILLEEPELGVHPHQLMQLMKFLKEESKTKQIIITTHSPITLDELDKNELNRIIIAYYSQDGTKLRHLDHEEIAKAKMYLKEDYISDYWKYSDLEKPSYI